MILISHRGNITGQIPEMENHPDYIDNAIKLGFDVEIDIWMNDGILYLGHDTYQYEISYNWLKERTDYLWIHCKNIEALSYFNILKSFHYFWHEYDTVTLTSKGFIWAYVGKQPTKNSIAVMPELNNDDMTQCIGICSDFIKNY
jgi:hypothetical protein